MYLVFIMSGRLLMSFCLTLSSKPAKEVTIISKAQRTWVACSRAHRMCWSQELLLELHIAYAYYAGVLLDQITRLRKNRCLGLWCRFERQVGKGASKSTRLSSLKRSSWWVLACFMVRLNYMIHLTMFSH
jgi:hypothetical protein